MYFTELLIISFARFGAFERAPLKKRETKPKTKEVVDSHKGPKAPKVVGWTMITWSGMGFVEKITVWKHTEVQ